MPPRGAQALDQIVAPVIADPVVMPHRSGQQVRHPIRRVSVCEGGTTDLMRRGLPTVSRLSASIPCVASCCITAPCSATSLSRADAVPSNAAKGRVKWCGWHGMQVLSFGALATNLPNEDAPTPMNRVNKSLERSSLPRT